ncbi:hypothetical protein H9W90_06505 [Polaribacter pectinis]|uniref:Uncharacterized protein n=1 Tax=Polaribacter pectinis TaxID=2738844 RepID=A0A7G9LDR4_9FLAO|nr:hypothetical protein [Polaribacter pectinis]QNM86763.1 hypothetical protein H9W90_06505 [Polaribacter pectinis]
MKSKYFGIFTKEKYNIPNPNEIIKLFIKDNIFKETVSGKILEQKKTNEKNGFEFRVGFNLNEREYYYTFELVSEVYSFMMTYFTGSLKIHLILFQRDFEIENYGLSEKKKKKKAKKIFDKLFFQLTDKKDIALNENKIDTNVIEKRFNSLKREQNKLIESLKFEEEILNNYLLGKKDFFTRELLDQNQLLLKIFEFEKKLSILIGLNKKFQFEYDDIFTPKPKAKLIYEEYSHEFHSLKQIEFIENQITSIEKVNRAFVKSLFDFFSNKLKIKTPSGKLFGEIINDYFSHNFSIIKLNGSEGDSHDDKIKKIEKDWEIFTN